MIHKLILELRYTEDAIYKMNFINACNWMSFFKERDDYIEQANNKAQNKMTT
jgi:hypothetical protein